ncbi:hypothetical protein BB560_002763 [Smittium megazygosporum]|uniref:glutamine--tRNA ligase n=1 Tax=Smittium megazygosporum TaxID=133381 RepID=A0A2T9ZDV7_9FUNG|nr:hypothetical protein BB560_002763 [Smittium megazygosporum]
MSSDSVLDLASQFESLHLSKEKALETAKNQKLAPVLLDALKTAQSNCPDLSKVMGTLIYALATTIPPEAKPYQNFLISEITNGNLVSNNQLTEALAFCKKSDPTASYQSFKDACGVGVVVQDSEISSSIADFLKENSEKLTKDRYRTLGPFLSQLRKIPNLKWASAEKIKTQLESQVEALIGPKDERDIPQKGKAKKSAKGGNAKAANNTKAATSKPEPKSQEYAPASLEKMFADGDISKLHKPGENPQVSKEIMDAHLKVTGRRVITRFPPEPNGYLHIGHAKAINVNFGYAKTHNGTCNLRYDDTNPETEETQYIVSILEAIKWLGFEPDKIFYASDYFDQLFELAVRMIKRGLGYVCHCTPEEIYAQRGGESMGPRTECKHRNRPIEESLEEFYKMRDGRYAQGEAVLRMKMDLEDGNPQMWDLIAYRILYATHHRTGDKWCIYPTYDFAHCLCDSIENITHSLCTTEFTQSRKSYYWLCDAVEVYKPVQWEYGRLSVTNTVLSKRRLLKLLNEGIIPSLDDPRLFTLPALRRRGVPAAAINGFVRELGVTTAKTSIEVSRLENHIRDCLNSIAPRLMVVLDPIKIRITNYDKETDLQVPFNPRDASFGTHTIPFTSTLYIDRSDFRLEASADYSRLAPNKTVGLLYAPAPITCTDVVYAADGTISEILCKLEDGSDGNPPPKAKKYIQWVPHCPARGSPVKLGEVRLYNGLFKHSNPYDKTVVPGGWLSDINPESRQTITTAIAETGIFDLISKFISDPKTSQVFSKGNYEELRFQFLRMGYFCVDKDSEFSESFKNLSLKNSSDSYNQLPSECKLVLNRIVTLKDSLKK